MEISFLFISFQSFFKISLHPVALQKKELALFFSLKLYILRLYAHVPASKR